MYCRCHHLTRARILWSVTLQVLSRGANPALALATPWLPLGTTSHFILDDRQEGIYLLLLCRYLFSLFLDHVVYLLVSSNLSDGSIPPVPRSSLSSSHQFHNMVPCLEIGEVRMFTVHSVNLFSQMVITNCFRQATFELRLYLICWMGLVVQYDHIS